VQTGMEKDGYDFDGRVAIVTGAGRGLGRAYALLLARRGARVVVNDLGRSSGEGRDPAPAGAVVEEILAAGGEAVADTHDVADPAAATALVDDAVDRFGRIDALVNNAGIVRWAGFPKADAALLAQHLDVHVGGSFHTTRAAWPHMIARGHGRVVMTTSSGLFGLSNNLAYATAKAGVVGLMRSLAVAGRPHGIGVNAIAPAAFTRMAGGAPEDEALSPDFVAPLAAYLAHPDCPASGEIYQAGAGRFARLFIGSTPGWVHGASPPSIEDLARNWDQIGEERGYGVPRDLEHWSSMFLSHRASVEPPSDQ
jgi:NAD(P)-dependent dehydrogenase (short-subunit alcohol dehydrogenase family)